MSIGNWVYVGVRRAQATLRRERGDRGAETKPPPRNLHLVGRRDAREIATISIDRRRITRCARRVTTVGPLNGRKTLARTDIGSLPPSSGRGSM
jgi:hypothetical protein